MSGGGSAEAINKTARDDSGDEAEAAADVSGAGKNQKREAEVRSVANAMKLLWACNTSL